jgi:hypothetical protein
MGITTIAIPIPTITTTTHGAMVPAFTWAITGGVLLTESMPITQDGTGAGLPAFITHGTDGHITAGVADMATVMAGVTVTEDMEDTTADITEVIITDTMPIPTTETVPITVQEPQPQAQDVQQEAAARVLSVSVMLQLPETGAETEYRLTA